MFDFLIEIDSEELKLGVDGFCQGDMTIKGQGGCTGSEYTMMIFISLNQLLYGISRLAKKEINEYKFAAIEGGFLFYIANKDNTWVITDKKDKIITESSTNDFILSIWRGVNKFHNTYRPLVDEVDSGIIDFDNSIEKFKTQFSNIIESSEKISSTKEPDTSQPSQPQTTEELLSFKPVFPPRPDHIIAPGIEGLFSEYFGQSYNELYQKYNSYRIIPLAVASYKERVDPVVVKLSIKEIKSLIGKGYDEKYLRDRIFPKYGIKVEMSRLGVTYIGFLERVHEELVGKKLYY